MIGSFKHKGLRLFYEQDDGRKLPQDMLKKIRAILTTLEASATIDGMSNPTFQLHPLKGDRRGQWSVTVRANWRIVFRFEDGSAHDVDFIDYH